MLLVLRDYCHVLLEKKSLKEDIQNFNVLQKEISQSETVPLEQIVCFVSFPTLSCVFCYSGKVGPFR